MQRLSQALRRSWQTCLVTASSGLSKRQACVISDASTKPWRRLRNSNRLHPRYSLLHEERGLCFVAQKDASRAIQSLLAAVTLNTALPHSWRMLEGLYRLTGDRQNASLAADHLATLDHLAPEVVSATSLFSDGDLDRAEPIIRAYLIQHGNHPDAMRLLARIGIAREVYDDAETLLEGVLTLAPDFHPARFNYAQVLMLRHKYAQARDQIEKLLALDPGSLEYRRLAASILVGLGEHERAVAIYTELLRETPKSPDLHLWLGHALKTMGSLPDAVEAYHAAVALRPDFGDGYWSLANLKTYRFSDEEIDRMRSEELKQTTAPFDRYHLCFALGKALEDRAIRRILDLLRAWQRAQRAESLYRPEVIEGNTQRQKTSVPKNSSWNGQAGDVRAPIRSSLSVCRAPGRPCSNRSWHRIPGLKEHMSCQTCRMPSPSCRGVGPAQTAHYIRLGSQSSPRRSFCAWARDICPTRRCIVSDRPFFIDKMPNNFRHIGLIHLMLPNARIIDARREPMSCCFSNLKQLFAQGQEFTYSVEDIARYYRTYLELMEHWDRVFPGQGSARAPRGCCGRSGRQRATHARVLRTGIRAGLHRVPQDQAQRADAKLRTGAPANLPRKSRAVEEFRTMARSAQG